MINLTTVIKIFLFILVFSYYEFSVPTVNTGFPYLITSSQLQQHAAKHYPKTCSTYQLLTDVQRHFNLLFAQPLNTSSSQLKPTIYMYMNEKVPENAVSNLNGLRYGSIAVGRTTCSLHAHAW